MVDCESNKGIVFDVFPQRSTTQFQSWNERHTQDFLKTICFEFKGKSQKKMDATKKSASFWLMALNKYIEFRSEHLTIIWLDFEGSIQMQNLRPLLYMIIKHIKSKCGTSDESIKNHSELQRALQMVGKQVVPYQELIYLTVLNAYFQN